MTGGEGGGFTAVLCGEEGGVVVVVVVCTFLIHLFKVASKWCPCLQGFVLASVSSLFSSVAEDREFEPPEVGLFDDDESEGLLSLPVLSHPLSPPLSPPPCPLCCCNINSNKQ